LICSRPEAAQLKSAKIVYSFKWAKKIVNAYRNIIMKEKTSLADDSLSA
jgi:hypothetical protein